MSYEYSLPIKNGISTYLLGEIDTGVGANATIEAVSAGDVVLSTIPLTAPAGTIDELTGILTITPDGRDEAAAASGDIAEMRVKNRDGDLILTIPTIAGIEPVRGYAVLSHLDILEGDPVEMTSFEIDAVGCS